jgi:hypothetical protein
MQDLLTKANLFSGVTLDVTIDDNYNSSGIKVVTATASKPFNWALSGPVAVNPNSGAATVDKRALTLKGTAIMKAETF